jgi:hypothetical protein
MTFGTFSNANAFLLHVRVKSMSSKFCWQMTLDIGQRGLSLPSPRIALGTFVMGPFFSMLHKLAYTPHMPTQHFHINFFLFLGSPLSTEPIASQ